MGELFWNQEGERKVFEEQEEGGMSAPTSFVSRNLPLLSELYHFFKGFYLPPAPTTKQNSVLHFLSSRRAPTLEVESKGRKAITSVLVIKRICIMNHMPKGPVLHVGQIFV